MEKEFILNINESEFHYLKGALKALVDIEGKVPAKFKTKNSNILKSLYKKLEAVTLELK